MSDITFYNPLEDMMEDSRRAIKEADARVRPAQAAIRPGQVAYARTKKGQHDYENGKTSRR